MRFPWFVALIACGNGAHRTDKPATGDHTAALRASLDSYCSDCHYAGSEKAPALTAITSDPLLAGRAAQMVGAQRMPPDGLDANPRHEIVMQLCRVATPHATSCAAHMIFEPPVVTRSSSEILSDIAGFAPASPGPPTSSVRQLMQTFDSPVVTASVTMESLLAVIAAERCPAAGFMPCATSILSLDLQALPPLPPTPGSR
jgi:hypothetical protein